MTRANFPNIWRNLSTVIFVLGLHPHLHAAGESDAIGWHALTVADGRDIDTLDSALNAAATTLQSRERAISNKDRRVRDDDDSWLKQTVPDIQKFLDGLRATLPSAANLADEWGGYLNSGYQGEAPAFWIEDLGLRTLMPSPPLVREYLSQVIHNKDFDPKVLTGDELDFLVCYYAQPDHGLCSSAFEDHKTWKERDFEIALQECNNLVALYGEEISRRFGAQPLDTHSWQQATQAARQGLEKRVLQLLEWKITTLMAFATGFEDAGPLWYLQQVLVTAQEIDNALSGKNLKVWHEGAIRPALILTADDFAILDEAYISDLHQRVLKLIGPQDASTE